MINKVNIAGTSIFLKAVSDEIQSLKQLGGDVFKENLPYYKDVLSKIFDPYQKYSLDIDVMTGNFTLQPHPSTEACTTAPTESSPTQEDPFGCQGCNGCGGTCSK